MTLLDRYLQAVRFWLAKDGQDDILEEISVDIRSETEDRESELGRKLDESEMAALLKKRGRPVVVANSYLPQRSLIGPVLFPIYVFTLRTAFLCYAVPWIVTPLLLILFSSAYRGRRSALDLMASLSGSAWIAALALFAVVTLIFAALEKAQAKSRFLDNWDPRQLPPLRTASDKRRIPRSSSVAEIVAGCIVTAWWVDASVAFAPTADVRWTEGAVWQDFHQRFYLGFLLTMLGWIAMACVNLVRPHWTRTRLVLRAGLNAIGSSMLIATLVRHWAESQTQLNALQASKASAPTAELEASVFNLVVYGLFAISAVISVSCLLYEVIRVARWNATRAWTPTNSKPVGVLPGER